MLAVMEAWLPWPMAVRAMTEAIPMTIPRTVSPERTLLADIAMTDSSRMSDELHHATSAAAWSGGRCAGR